MKTFKNEIEAQEYHNHSRRKEKPFCVVDCSMLRDQLLRSELFGHEKGAFHGAYSRKIGLFEAANYGTLILLNLNTVELTTRLEILNVIDTKQIIRVGGRTPIDVDVFVAKVV